MELDGKVAVVTGGTKGIGRAIAEALLEHGARVVIGARTESDVDRVTEELGERAHGVVCDVRNADDCGALVEAAESTFGGLDILINNAGIGIFKEVEELTVEEWDRLQGTNLDGVFYCTHAAIPRLKERGGGWIINIGSLAGKNAFPGGAAYNTSKFGLIGFSEALMQEVRHDGIRVSYIMPGSVATSGFSGGGDWKIQPEDIGRIVLDLLATPDRTLPSRVEVRPSRPPKK
ncbi:MAG: SDR family oxidoreductase [Longimicrobiales bacterium]|nr:SDR family oxidoreductase [Longimicrobiales bacterium]